MPEVGSLELALRIAFEGHGEISKKAMMGGVCFFHMGNMLGGVDNDERGAERLMFRVGKTNESQALSLPGTSPVVLGGRRMGGMIFLNGAKATTDKVGMLAKLVFDFVGSMPPK